MVDERWEVGSEFHLMEFDRLGDPALPSEAMLFGSGRDAIRELIRFGAAELNWKRFWIPSYFCQQVVEQLQTPSIQLRTYPANPLDDCSDPVSIPSDEPGGVLSMSYFGLHSRCRPVVTDRSKVAVVEDHSHDPWSTLALRSEADYCLASLRKTVPIPDGGLLWSPEENRPMPKPVAPTRDRINASMQKLAGMVLKAIYLNGGPVEKDEFRKHLVAGEQALAEGEISGMPAHTMTLLNEFPALEWRECRRRNFETFASKFANDDVRVLRPDPGATPLSIVLMTSNHALRHALRLELISRRVYPAILWQLEEPTLGPVDAEALDVSRRMLSIHCDGRYGEEDMTRLANVVKDACRSAAVAV